MDAVQHFELPYKSRDRAKKFYFDVFDWQLFDLAGSDYTLASSVDTHTNGMPKRPGAINGGLVARRENTSAPSLMIHVGEVRSHLDRIRRNGGTILTEPVKMGPVIYARFSDSEGNVLAVFEDAPEGAAPAAKPSSTMHRASPPKKSSKAKPKRKAASKKGRAAAKKGKAAAKKGKATRKKR